MAKVEFKGKIKDMYWANGDFNYKYIKVPRITKIHCDMVEFRNHIKIGPLANSDLFEAIINKKMKDIFPKNKVILSESLPKDVKVDESGFLAIVTVDI